MQRLRKTVFKRTRFTVAWKREVRMKQGTKNPEAGTDSGQGLQSGGQAMNSSDLVSPFVVQITFSQIF